MVSLPISAQAHVKFFRRSFFFALFVGPDDHPALTTTAEVPAPLLFATGDAPKTAQGPATEGLTDLNLSITDTALDMNFAKTSGSPAPMECRSTISIQTSILRQNI